MNCPYCRKRMETKVVWVDKRPSTNLDRFDKFIMGTAQPKPCDECPSCGLIFRHKEEPHYV